MLKTGITEIDIAYEDKAAAKEQCMAVFEEAAGCGVELLVFPEMTLAGFTLKPERMGESYRGGRIPESISFFMKNSRKYNMAVAFGYIEESMADGSPVITDDGEKVYRNKLALVKGDNLVLDYAKIHPFSYSGEDKAYHAGDKLCQAKVRDIRLGGYICYDLRFPEIFTAARDKYDAILVIANWPKQRVSQWNTLLAARAIENQAYAIGVNRVGEGNGESYVASSHVYDCYGNDIAVRVSDRLLVAELDSKLIEQVRRSFPQGQDRRNRLYCSLLSQ